MSTNNRMELQAAISALKVLQPSSVRVHLFTDSKYLMDGIQKWIHNWHSRGWRTASNKPVINQELWQELWALTINYTIKWTWVRGHASNRYNNFVDRLAREAIFNRRGIDIRLDIDKLEGIIDGR